MRYEVIENESWRRFTAENGTARNFTVEKRRRESPMNEWNRFDSDELRKVSVRVNRFIELFWLCKNETGCL